MIELLAPARDLSCGRTAIDCGADAVYIGAKRFGARAKAGNSLTDIEALTRHAHTYWAKVYVTLKNSGRSWVVTGPKAKPEKPSQ